MIRTFFILLLVAMPVQASQFSQFGIEIPVKSEQDVGCE